MQRFLIRRWFLLSLAAVLAAGFLAPRRFEAAAADVPREWVVASVLFLMALPLEIGAMWRAMRRPGPTLLAVAISYGVLPPAAFLASRFLSPDLATGLIVTGAIPCTLASASVWTRRAGGNDAVSILVTIVTNLLCFVVTPAWLLALTGSHVELKFFDLLVHLAKLVVAPIIFAQLLRVFRPIAVWSTRHKLSLALLAQLGILTMVFVGAVQSGLRLLSAEGAAAIGWRSWLVMIVLAAGTHLVVCYLGYYLAALLKMPTADRIAVAISGSQKTLMVGLDIGLQYFGGLTILPMVVYHVSQLLLDTWIADRWRAAGEPTAAAADIVGQMESETAPAG